MGGASFHKARLMQSKRSPARFAWPVLGSCLRSAGNECVPCDAVCCPSLVTGGHSGWGAAAPCPCPYIQFPMLDEFVRTVPTYILIILRSFVLNIKASYRC